MLYIPLTRSQGAVVNSILDVLGSTQEKWPLLFSHRGDILALTYLFLVTWSFVIGLMKAAGMDPLGPFPCLR